MIVRPEGWPGLYQISAGSAYCALFTAIMLISWGAQPGCTPHQKAPLWEPKGQWQEESTSEARKSPKLA